MEVKVTDNSKEVLNAFKRQMKVALQSVGNTAEGYAKEDCPVDTGRLRNSIANEVDTEESAVYIGTNVEYAKYVEFGDNKNFTSGKAHFLRDAAARHTDEYQSIVETILRN